MIDLNTGRFSWGEGYALWPGMTRREFEESELYRRELPDAVKRAEEPDLSYALKAQNINGFEIEVIIAFDQDDFLRRINIAHPDNYKNEKEWPSDTSDHDHLLFIKDYNDRFLAVQMGAQLEGGRELSFDFPWGTISSSCSYLHFPEAEINIVYDTYLFKPDQAPADGADSLASS